MSFEATENLSERAQEIINELFDSGSSESHAVADCLNTIAENGNDQATDKHLVCCSEQIIAAAQRVIDGISAGESATQKLKALKILDEVSLHHRVQLRPEEALAYFDKNSKHHELINCINEAIPRMNFEKSNPNNGRMFHEFWVGREYSRVIYVDVVTAYLGDHNEHNEIYKRLERLAKLAWADEFSVDREDGCWTYRFWWD